MKLKAFTILSLGLITFALHAQRQLDSLYQLAQHEEDTIVLVEVMNQAAYVLININPDSTILIGQKSEQLAKRINYTFGATEAKMRQANGYAALGNYYLALNLYLEVKKTYDSLQNTSKIAACLNNIGMIYNFIDDYDRALSNYKAAAALFAKLKDSSRQSIILNNIGHIYKKQDEYILAMEYLYQSLKLGIEVHDQNIEILPVYNLGSTYMLIDHYDSAEFYLNKSKEMALALDNQYILSLTLIDEGRMYMKSGVVQKAEHAFKEAFDVATKIHLRPQRKQASLYLSELYEQRSMFNKALMYHKLYKALDDSLFNRDLAKRMAFQEAKYELDNEQIIKEAKQKQTQLEQQKALNNAIWVRNTLIAGLLAMFFISYLIYKNYSRNKMANKALQKLNYQIESQAEKLRQANSEITEMNNDLEMMVNRRAKELEKRNQQLKEYISSNSHIVRAPLARILGLVDLYKPGDSENLDFINKSIHESATELDNALREINQKLNDEENIEKE
ncbi:MAG: tetratricopeptide repeat protein [Ekhidna sp.]